MKSKKILKALREGRKIKNVEVTRVNSHKKLIFWLEGNLFHTITVKEDEPIKLEITLNGRAIKTIKL